MASAAAGVMPGTAASCSRDALLGSSSAVDDAAAVSVEGATAALSCAFALSAVVSPAPAQARSADVVRPAMIVVMKRPFMNSPCAGAPVQGEDAIRARQ